MSTGKPKKRPTKKQPSAAGASVPPTTEEMASPAVEAAETTTPDAGPAVETLTTEQPVTEQPTTEQPTTEQPTIEESVQPTSAADAPVAPEPADGNPAAKEPAVEDPAVEQPVEEPVVAEPVVTEPVVEEPSAPELAVEAPEGDGSADVPAPQTAVVDPDAVHVEPAMSEPAPEPDAESATETATELPGEPAARPRGRAALRASLVPRPTPGHLLGALLCAVLGFALVIQVRSTSETGLAGLRPPELVRLLDDTSAAYARLEAETRELEAARSRIAAGAGDRAAQDEARALADKLSILAGTVPVTGPGIEFVIPDPDERVSADALLDAVEELRGAGAESISVGPVRVIASSAFTDGDNGGVLLDGTLLPRPYRFLVVGDPRTLSSALAIPGGVLEGLRVRDGADAIVTKKDSLLIEAVRTQGRQTFARPTK